MQPHRHQPTSLPHPWDSPGKNTGVGCHFLLQCMKGKSESEVAQLCPTLSNPMDCSLPGSSVHGILQARVLEWVAIAFSSTRLAPGKTLEQVHILNHHQPKQYLLALCEDSTHFTGKYFFSIYSVPVFQTTDWCQWPNWRKSLPSESFPGGSDGRESACNTGDPGSIPRSGRSPGGRNGNPLLPGEPQGQRSLVGYSPWGGKESDMTD